ncbi:MAG: hypothetical protein PHU25_15570 [Deltaproteobacteria bacterium]|nr:hypothetical protein [Deltaproteobacteria bacterium]
MTDRNETKRSEADVGTRQVRGPKRGATIAVVAGLAFVVAATAVYVFARNLTGVVPALPRPAFDEKEVRAAMEGFDKGDAAFEASPEEQVLADLLERIHMAETDASALANRGTIAALVEEFGDKARQSVARGKERFLALGDHLAARFGREFTRFSAVAAASGVAAWGKKSREAEALRRAGGAFLERSVERGLVDASGRLRAPALTPVVLFKSRWRLLAGLHPDEGFTPLERKARLDFVAAFSSPDGPERRLAAAIELKRLDPAYDDVLARAVILHEAAQDRAALDLLEKAGEAGRDDPVLRSFARALLSPAR